MHLLVMILDKASDLERILEKWREIGVTGATVIDTIGIGPSTLYGTDAPIIASLKRIFDSESRTYNHMLLSVIKKKKTLEDAIRVAQEVCGPFHEPDVGILFTIKLDQVLGFTTPEMLKK